MATAEDGCCVRRCGLKPFVALCVAFSSMTSVLLGYDIGIMSGAKVRIKQDFKLSDSRVETLVGILSIISAFGGVTAGQLADWLGRRRTVALANLVFLVGALGMALAPNYGLLFVGRVVTGVGVGAGMMVGPLYTAELAPKHLRGALVSFSEISINIGILAGYLVAYLCYDMAVHVGWRVMLGLGALLPAVMLIALFWMPESPRWLLQNGRTTDARMVLRRCYQSEEEVDATITMIEEEKSTELSWRQQWAAILRPSSVTRQMLLVGLGVAFYQQASGCDAAVYYTPEILKETGLDGDKTILLATAGIGLVKVAFIFPAVFTLDRCGRKPIIIASTLGVAVAQLMMASNFLMGGNVALAVVAQCLFMAQFSLGLGPICWVLTSEVFAINIRGLAMGLATFVNRMVSGIISLTFLSMTKSLSPAGAFIFFAVVAVLAALFIGFVVPETKGQSLEEIERAFATRAGADDFEYSMDNFHVGNGSHPQQALLGGDGGESHDDDAAAEFRDGLRTAASGSRPAWQDDSDSEDELFGAPTVTSPLSPGH